MAGRNYPRLGIQEFGESLLSSNDLDPVYVALTSMKWNTRAQLYRWLLSYWCFYSAGVASYMSELSGDRLIVELLRAVVNEQPAPHGGRWERGKERRHFRGAQAEKALTHLVQRYNNTPESMATQLRGCAPSYSAIADHVRSHVGFGPWITFKIADMCDRVLGWPVDFEEEVVFMFKDPREAALMYWRQQDGLDPHDSTIIPGDRVDTNNAIAAVVRELTAMFAGTAPPAHDRRINIQEIETILCKWKSHMRGHYPINNDLDEINEGLEPWLEHSLTARKFKKAMPHGDKDTTSAN